MSDYKGAYLDFETDFLGLQINILKGSLLPTNELHCIRSNSFLDQLTLDELPKTPHGVTVVGLAIF
jgi:hypothetical protein